MSDLPPAPTAEHDPGAPEQPPAVAGDLARVLGFLHGFARRRAPRVLPAPGGFAVLDDRFPGSYDDNKLIVTEDADPALLLKAADDLLATRGHRLVCVDDDRLGTTYTPVFAAAGYERETTLVMTFTGGLPEAPPPAERLEPDELLPVLRRDWRHTLPEAPEEVIEGLARRVEARAAGADVVRFYGVRTPSGEIAARADLYVHDGVAQIENVFTGHLHRGAGHARALMTALLAEASALLGDGLIFLLADAGDWPHGFYRRLGFTELARTHAFLRA
ncbi:GNAT family N-acetyltransferase [Nonomuraea salmonea]|uniref:GNAT family N-acetyltransferase n=1 Tax=Nonomuraea salmonea TaxID=46181 RepID=A0ABV5NIA2_9ACTN